MGHRRFLEKEGRHSFYDMAHNLMEKGCKTEGRLLLLAGWNSAWFSKVSSRFKINDFEEALEECEPLFDNLKTKELENINLSEFATVINKIYSKLACVEAIKYTGASKLMSLEIPGLFVMWDNAIREKYNVGKTQGDYVKFLEKVKNATSKVVWNKKKEGIPLAKAIDEYNFVTITLKQSKK